MVLLNAIHRFDCSPKRASSLSTIWQHRCHFVRIVTDMQRKWPANGNCAFESCSIRKHTLHIREVCRCKIILSLKLKPTSRWPKTIVRVLLLHRTEHSFLTGRLIKERTCVRLVVLVIVHLRKVLNNNICIYFIDDESDQFN